MLAPCCYSENGEVQRSQIYPDLLEFVGTFLLLVARSSRSSSGSKNEIRFLMWRPPSLHWDDSTKAYSYGRTLSRSSRSKPSVRRAKAVAEKRQMHSNAVGYLEHRKRTMVLDQFLVKSMQVAVKSSRQMLQQLTPWIFLSHMPCGQ